jgi:RNA polymerase subunit RPABC4/transcription elongation factor Spt4
MSKKKVCRNCRYVYEDNVCPVCKSSATASSHQGRLFIINPEKSEIAQKISAKTAGEYAIKVR